MSLDLVKRVVLVWLGLFVVAFVNGALREVLIKRVIAEPMAHHLSALTAVLLLGAYTWAVWRRTAIQTLRQAVIVGAVWFVLTVLTETIVLNRWTSNMTWDQIVRSYDITRGELWPLVLIFIGALPAMMFATRGPARK